MKLIRYSRPATGGVSQQSSSSSRSGSLDGRSLLPSRPPGRPPFFGFPLSKYTRNQSLAVTTIKTNLFARSLQLLKSSEIVSETYCPFAGVLPPFERPGPYSLPSARMRRVLRICMCFLACCGFKFNQKRGHKESLPSRPVKCSSTYMQKKKKRDRNQQTP